MLNIEQIENIIKSKYNNLVITSTDCFTRFMFDVKDIVSHKEIIFYFDSKDKLYYEKEIWNTEARYQDCNFVIENNAIELKHLLDIEITQQDIIDWLSSIDFKHNNNNYYVENNKNHLSLCKTENVDYEINGTATAEIESSFLFIPRYKTAYLPINKKFKKELKIELFKATNNSQDYWRLYNIIKNLKE